MLRDRTSAVGFVLAGVAVAIAVAAVQLAGDRRSAEPPAPSSQHVPRWAFREAVRLERKFGEYSVHRSGSSTGNHLQPDLFRAPVRGLGRSTRDVQQLLTPAGWAWQTLAAAPEGHWELAVHPDVPWMVLTMTGSPDNVNHFAALVELNPAEPADALLIKMSAALAIVDQVAGVDVVDRGEWLGQCLADPGWKSRRFDFESKDRYFYLETGWEDLGLVAALGLTSGAGS